MYEWRANVQKTKCFVQINLTTECKPDEICSFKIVLHASANSCKMFCLPEQLNVILSPSLEIMSKRTYNFADYYREINET